MRKCGLALTVRTCSTHYAANGGRKTDSSDRRRPLYDHREVSVVSLWGNAGLPSLHMQRTLHFFTTLIPLFRSHQGGENTGVSLLSRNASVPETDLSSKTTPVGCSQGICLHNLTYFSSYVSPEYGCIMFPQNLGIRPSVCTVSQHWRL